MKLIEKLIASQTPTAIIDGEVYVTDATRQPDALKDIVVNGSRYALTHVGQLSTLHTLDIQHRKDKIVADIEKQIAPTQKHKRGLRAFLCTDLIGKLFPGHPITHADFDTNYEEFITARDEILETISGIDSPSQPVLVGKGKVLELQPQERVDKDYVFVDGVNYHITDQSAAWDLSQPQVTQSIARYKAKLREEQKDPFAQYFNQGVLAINDITIRETDEGFTVDKSFDEIVMERQGKYYHFKPNTIRIFAKGKSNTVSLHLEAKLLDLPYRHPFVNTNGVCAGKRMHQHLGESRDTIEAKISTKAGRKHLADTIGNILDFTCEALQEGYKVDVVPFHRLESMKSCASSPQKFEAYRKANNINPNRVFAQSG